MKNVSYKSRIAVVYTLLHFFVDLTTVYFVSSVLMGPQVGIADWSTVIILYNLIAFAGQLPIGIMADIVKKNPHIASIGCILAAMAYPVAFIFPWVACVLAAIGNGAFHIGGGVDILRVSMPKSGLSGLFVSTGAFGVWLAYKLKGELSLWICPVIMLVGALLIMGLCRKKEVGNTHKIISFKKPEATVVIAVSGFMLTIVIRSLMGMVMNFPWKSVSMLSLTAVVVVVLGKCLGGFIADRFGAVKTAVCSLMLAFIMFLFGTEWWATGIIGVLCFNMTMPLTLTAIGSLVNEKYGFAFGMTTFALAIGFIPTVFGLEKWFGVPFLTICTALSLFLMVMSYVISDRGRG